MTHALAADSPALGHSTECASPDQRGAARLGPPCDSGAYERGVTPPPAPAPPPGVPDVDGDGLEDLDDACPQAAGERTDGCPEPSPAGPAVEAGKGGAAKGRQLPAFNVSAALLKRGRLMVAARVSPGAGGRCQVVLRGRGKAVRFQVPVRLQRISFSRALPRALRGAGALRLTLRYPGARSVAAAQVSLLAGSRTPQLRLRTAKLKAGRLLAGGRISPLARGLVQVTVLPTLAGSGKPLKLSARIKRGKWAFNRRLQGLTDEHRRVLISYRGLRARGIGGAQFSRGLRGAGGR